jgi:hypothetical protein
LKNYSYLLFGFTLLGYSCISPPENFPSTPEIGFSSLEYVGINRHEGQNVGLYDTVITRDEYESTFENED